MNIIPWNRIIRFLWFGQEEDLHDIADPLLFCDPVGDLVGKGDDFVEMGCNLRKEIDPGDMVILFCWDLVFSV